MPEKKKGNNSSNSIISIKDNAHLMTNKMNESFIIHH